MFRYLVVFGVTSAVIRPYLLGQNPHKVGTHLAQGAGLGFVMWLLDAAQSKRAEIVHRTRTGG